MNQQSVGAFRMYRYRLEPGDATRYEFFLAPLDEFSSGFTMGAPEDGHLESKVGDLITGVNGREEEFVTLGICMPSGQGVYEMSKRCLRNPDRNDVCYLAGHMPGVQSNYTIAAVLLACSVLVDEPFNLADAAKAMLQVPELLICGGTNG